MIKMPPNPVVKHMRDLGAFPVDNLDGGGTRWVIWIVGGPPLLIDLTGYHHASTNRLDGIEEYVAQYRQRCKLLGPQKVGNEDLAAARVKFHVARKPHRCDFAGYTVDLFHDLHPIWQQMRFAWLGCDWYTPLGTEDQEDHGK